MNISRLMIGATLVPGLSLTAAFTTLVQSQDLTTAPAGSTHHSRSERFRPTGVIQNEGELNFQNRPGVTEAPTSFDNQTKRLSLNERSGTTLSSSKLLKGGPC